MIAFKYPHGPFVYKYGQHSGSSSSPPSRRSSNASSTEAVTHSVHTSQSEQFLFHHRLFGTRDLKNGINKMTPSTETLTVATLSSKHLSASSA
mmetsp:Transcript_35096/g.56440  ORF Transcript_35096/g.56440 Transcript_35096/m.56440 type:complete len:93 (-) Transcript_35096:95-373(-)